VQIGEVTAFGRRVGVVTWTDGEVADPFVPDLGGYEPEGRAADTALGSPSGGRSGASHHHRGSGGSSPGHTSKPSNSSTKADAPAPRGNTYDGGQQRPFRQGTAETDEAIRAASQAHNLDPDFMRATASIESGMNPSSNAHKRTQYKGLYQVGHNEWDRFGNGGNIYSAKDNAMGAARMFDANRGQFKKKFGRDPTDTEMYMMHQQGLGFYTRGAMTNIGGNPYPGMRGRQTHESFEAGWGREIARRKAGFEAARPAPVVKPTEAMPPVQPLGVKSSTPSRNDPIAPDRRRHPDDYISGMDGKVRRRPQNKAEWGFDQWSDMRRSDNVEDRQSGDSTLKGKKRRDIIDKKFAGTIDDMVRGGQEHNSPMSKSLGIDSLPFKEEKED
jgi:hypothetical protein